MTARRTPRSGWDLRNTWQVVAGAILVPLGIVIILLAWYGSAHSPYVQGQIPYVISGGLLGLGLMVLGGLLYWAHWLYRIYDQSALHHEEMLRLVRGQAGPGAPVEGPGAPEPVLVATARGRNFHRPECSLVVSGRRPTHRLSPQEAANLVPCRICRPSD